ncbi:TFIIB-type zinc ribbon-containing protein [archaeon]|nr:TFIIB-type zinc ribbon-containing protein [archaeon]
MAERTKSSSSTRRYCPECGGELLYEPETRNLVCTSCGLVYDRYLLMQKRREIREAIAKSLREPSSPELERIKKRREYLQWLMEQ